MSHKLTFTLKQHTPLIHFQHDQSGATLRATELKPKLDRFLIEKLEMLNEEEKPKDRYKSWFIGNGEQHLSLNYKIKLIATDPVLKNPNKFLFFANNLLKNHQKLKMVSYANITINIISFHKDLITIIDDNIDIFFAKYNFGMRQSKGYGSFYREKPKINFLSALHMSYPNIYRSRVFDQFERAVDKIHKTLKSGINFNGYTKSILFQYTCSLKQPIGWEKKKIKKEFPEVLRDKYKSPVDCRQNKNENYKFIRAVLGLADHYEFNGGPKIGGEYINISHESIKRFKSPLLYKVYNKNIFIVYDDSYKKLIAMGGEYLFELEGFDKTFSIPTFSTDDNFSMESFLDFACNNKDGKKLIEKVHP